MLEKVWYFVLFSVKKASQRVMEQKGDVLGDPSIGREGRSRSDSTLGERRYPGVTLLAGESLQVLYSIHLVTLDREAGSCLESQTSKSGKNQGGYHKVRGGRRSNKISQLERFRSTWLPSQVGPSTQPPPTWTTYFWTSPNVSPCLLRVEVQKQDG